jgi:hypothetical protein
MDRLGVDATVTAAGFSQPSPASSSRKPLFGHRRRQLFNLE